MNKSLIRVFSVLLIAVMMLFVSCEASPGVGGGVDDESPKNPLVGRWFSTDSEMAVLCEFSEFGTFALKNDLGGDDGLVSSFGGWYETKDNKIELEIANAHIPPVEAEYKIENGALSIHSQISEEALEVLYNVDEEIEGVKIDEKLVGKWTISIFDETESTAINVSYEFTKSGLIIFSIADSSDIESNAIMNTVVRLGNYYVDKEAGKLIIDDASFDYSVTSSRLSIIAGGEIKQNFIRDDIRLESSKFSSLVGTYEREDESGSESLIFLEDGTLISVMDGQIEGLAPTFDVNAEELRIPVNMYEVNVPFAKAENGIMFDGEEYKKVEQKDFSPYLAGVWIDNMSAMKIEFANGEYTIYSREESVGSGKYTVIGRQVILEDRTLTLTGEFLSASLVDYENENFYENTNTVYY